MEDAVVSLVTDPDGNIRNHMKVRQYYREGLIYNYSVCLGGAWHGNKVSTQWFVEWMEANIIFGAEKFIIHKMGMPSSMDQYVDYYERRGLLEVLPWNVERITSKGRTRSHLQMTLLYDCLYRMRRRTTYMVQTDQDELIVPRHPDDVTWSDMIRRSGCEPGACVYGARQLFYGLHYSTNSQNANTTGLVMIDTTQRSTEVSGDGVRSKYIADTFTTTLVVTHQASCKPGAHHCTLPVDIGANHHYRWKITSYDEQRGSVIDNSTQKYKNLLANQVAKVIEKVNDSA